MIILTKLILAHLVGDFLFQTSNWVKKKEQYKAKSWILYFHVLIHGLLAFMALGSFEYWFIVLIIVITHFLIDAAKLYFQKNKTRIQWFVADQLLHLMVIIGVWVYWFDTGLCLYEFLTSNEFLLTVTASYFLTQPMAVIMSVIMTPWSKDIPDNKDASLLNAGKYIGILERLFVFCFILTGHWEAVGFLIAAKSVFRFGDLRKSKERKLTEYILIGTLVSFGFAIGTGLVVVFVLTNI